jgi:hypothetical protein
MLGKNTGTRGTGMRPEVDPKNVLTQSEIERERYKLSRLDADAFSEYAAP